MAAKLSVPRTFFDVVKAGRELLSANVPLEARPGQDESRLRELKVAYEIADTNLAGFRDTANELAEL